jgi:hypothetical protein
MRSIYYSLLAFLAMICLLLPDLVLAAGGKADLLIVVADDRVVQWSFSKFFLHLYNTDPFMFGVWCTIITAALGVTLGVTTDQIMRHTGIDLTKRTIVEH